MKRSQVWLAPAKINLFLHITSRRDDGMHELQTAFQFVDLMDMLEFDIHPHDTTITRASHIDHVPESEDLVIRAAQLLQQWSQVSQGATIKVEKNIPMGGGLGGASSDAATTLQALNQLWGVHATVDQLTELGYKLGADVPVFIRGQSAWAEGVGEQLTPIDFEEYWYLIVDAGVHVSTREMFAHSQLTRNSPTLTICPPKPGEFGNVFEPIARAQHPEIDKIFEWLNHHGSPFLTGTGGCVVAAFTDKQSALEVKSQSPDGVVVHIAQGRNQSPLLEQL